MVHTDAYGRMVLLADIEEGYQPVFNLFEFLGIFLVGIFLLDEFSCGIYIVSRVDAHLFGIFRSHIGHMRIEMHIGHKRRAEPISSNGRTDVFQILSLARALCRQPDKFSSRLDDALGLSHRTCGIVCCLP